MKWQFGMLAVGAAMAAATASAAMTGKYARWDGDTAEAWTCYDLVNQRPAASLSVTGGCARLTYPAQGLAAPPEEHLLRADAAASAGAFAGDFMAAGVKGCALRVKSSEAADAMLLLRGASGNWWGCPVPLDGADTWQDIAVPLAAGTWLNLDGTTRGVTFAEDLTHVQWFGFAVRRASSVAAQTYAVDDIVLLDTDPRFTAWMAQYGGGRPGDDLDGDGVRNEDEWVAGTSANDPDDLLKLRIDRMPEGAVRVSWPGRSGRLYTLERLASPGGPALATPSAIAAAPPTNIFIEAAPDGRLFYQLSVRHADDL